MNQGSTNDKPVSWTDWDKAFQKALRLAKERGLTPTLKVSNKKPTHETARNIWKEDSKLILEAAKQHGFELLAQTKHSADFIWKIKTHQFESI